MNSEIKSHGNHKPATSCQLPVNSIQHRASSIEYPVSSTQYPVSSTQYPAAKNQYRASSNQQPATSIEQPASSIEHPVSSIQHPTSSAQHPASGFTLLEVMIAMAIMAIVLISVYRLHSQTLTMATANRFYTQAPLLAQSKMAQLEAISSDVVSGDSGDFGDKFPGYAWGVSTEEVSSEALGETAGDLKRIDVTVTLNQNEYEYTIRLYRLIAE
jgi:general secretion pathway protein I